SYPSRDSLARITIVSGDFDDSHHEVFLKIESVDKRPLTGSYSLIVSPDRVTAGDRYGAWIYAQSEGAFGVPQEVDTVADPADAEAAVSVANYVTRTNWTDRAGTQLSLCQVYLCPD